MLLSLGLERNAELPPSRYAASALQNAESYEGAWRKCHPTDDGEGEGERGSG
jgi:hypothetical protein